jgi:hypothetical protein
MRLKNLSETIMLQVPPTGIGILSQGFVLNRLGSFTMS